MIKSQIIYIKQNSNNKLFNKVYFSLVSYQYLNSMENLMTTILLYILKMTPSIIVGLFKMQDKSINLLDGW